MIEAGDSGLRGNNNAGRGGRLPGLVPWAVVQVVMLAMSVLIHLHRHQVDASVLDLRLGDQRLAKAATSAVRPRSMRVSRQLSWSRCTCMEDSTS